MNLNELIEKWQLDKDDAMDAWESAIAAGSEELVTRNRIQVSLINQFLTDLKELE